MTRRQLAWIFLGTVGAVAAAGVAWSVLGTNRIVLTEPQIQERVNRQLPREVKGITVERTAVAVADNRIALRVDVHATALNQTFAATAFARGTPRYDGERGEVFFDADDVKLEKFSVEGGNPGGRAGELGSRLGGRVGEALKDRLEGTAGNLISAGVKAYLAARPVYRFKDDVKGVMLKAALHDVAIEGSTVVISVSIISLTVLLAVLLVALLGAVVLVVLLIRHPAWGRSAPKPQTATSS